MEWADVIDAAESISWVAAIATTGADGRPAVSFVSPGLGDDRVYVATRPGSRKVRNVSANPAVAFHWPVTDGGVGQLFLRGDAQIHATAEQKQRIWNDGGWRYDPAQFFGEVTNPDLVFLEVTPRYASLLGPNGTQVWRPRLAANGER